MAEKICARLKLPTADIKIIRDLEAGLRFMSDAIRTPLFLQEELERERQVVLGEYDRAESDPGFHLYVAVSRALWGDDYGRKNVIGSRPVWYMHAAMSKGLGMKSCTWSGR